MAAAPSSSAPHHAEQQLKGPVPSQLLAWVWRRGRQHLAVLGVVLLLHQGPVPAQGGRTAQPSKADRLPAGSRATCCAGASAAAASGHLRQRRPRPGPSWSRPALAAARRHATEAAAPAPALEPCTYVAAFRLPWAAAPATGQSCHGLRLQAQSSHLSPPGCCSGAGRCSAPGSGCSPGAASSGHSCMPRSSLANSCSLSKWRALGRAEPACPLGGSVTALGRECPAASAPPSCTQPCAPAQPASHAAKQCAGMSSRARSPRQLQEPSPAGLRCKHGKPCLREGLLCWRLGARTRPWEGRQADGRDALLKARLLRGGGLGGKP